MDNRRIIFNNRAQLTIEEPPLYLFANDPAVLLEETRKIDRNAAQQARLAAFPKPAPPGRNSLFDTDLTWAYRGYIVHLLSAPGDGDNAVLPLGFAPSQPITLQELQAIEKPQGGSRGSPGARPEQDYQELYLFNVLVALEWYPNRRYLRQLSWAFRRASDFLYDVTDGFMAFGQVAFGGPELMDCADIQIMASNRLLPRSWVSGLHTPGKYMPIRAGRGIWHKNNHVTIPWDEPEAYRTLIHEWSHYALELRDEYLELRQVGSASSSGDDPVLIDDRGSKKVVVPRISMALETIMATLEGTSELVPQDEGSSAERKSNVWKYIAEKERFPSTNPHVSLDGPGGLPLPLPRFRYLDKLAREGEPAGRMSAGGAAAEPSEGLRFFPPDMIDSEHCWIYVLRGPQGKPAGLIAQGTFDARSEADGFRLFGAAKDDTVVLIGHVPNDGAPIVLRNRIAGTEPDALFAAGWEVATPAAFPLIDVLPEPVNRTDQMAKIRVCVTPQDQSLPDQVMVFPLGKPSQSIPLERVESDSAVWLSQVISVPTLDGHVLVRWGDKLVISAFSQGGGPLTNTPVGPPPISAGSSEGNLMLFFGNETTMTEPITTESGEDYSDVRVVTTLLHGMERTVWGAGQARSYTFSLASTKQLPTDFNPTLIMHYDAAAARDAGDLIVCRQKGAGSWERLPTYCRPGSSFAAVPLNEHGAGGALVAAESQGSRVERYRLYWMPRADAEN